MVNATLSLTWQSEGHLRAGNTKRRCNLGMFLVVSIMPVIAQGQPARLALSAKELKGLAPEMKASEKRIVNIKIESEAWIERKVSLDDPCEPWERTPIYVSCTAWFDGPGTKMRVDLHKEVLEWKEGFAPYLERSYSMGFDGHYGREVNHTITHSGKTFSIKEGKRLADSPIALKLGWVGAFTGIDFSYQYSATRRSYAFSQVVQMAVDDPGFAGKSEFEFNWEEDDRGVKCFRAALSRWPAATKLSETAHPVSGMRSRFSKLYS